MRKIRIGNCLVGEGCEPFIIAEAGINHNGDPERAYEMIKVAKESGADAVKFQTFIAKEFIADPKLSFTYRSQGKEVTESMLEMFQRYELSEDTWPLIKSKCEKEGIIFLSTPQNRTDLDILLKVGVPAIKVGSDDFTNTVLLKDYTRTGLPVIVSCGMADMKEIRQSLEAIGAAGGYPVVLMLCTSEYPAPAESVNILRLKALSGAFPEIVLGFSDHTRGFLAASMAVALGASVFEKHFTLSHDLPGPDHWFSENPEGLKRWVSSIKEASVMMGSGLVKPTREEETMRRLARRSIVAILDIKDGEILSSYNVGLRRSGDGLPPHMYEDIAGCKATGPIKKGAQLKPGDFK